MDIFSVQSCLHLDKGFSIAVCITHTYTHTHTSPKERLWGEGHSEAMNFAAIDRFLNSHLPVIYSATLQGQPEVSGFIRCFSFCLIVSWRQANPVIQPKRCSLHFQALWMGHAQLAPLLHPSASLINPEDLFQIFGCELQQEEEMTEMGQDTLLAWQQVYSACVRQVWDPSHV